MLHMKYPQLIILLFILTSSLHAVKTHNTYQKIQDLSTLKILTPSLAAGETAKIKLSNGLQVYLISDSGAPQSAASLAMKVGSFCDPNNALGIAHFVEHLLFLGSKRYPKQHGYKQYISNHNGQSNAYTADDQTVYTFSISNSAFSEALDRFAANFIEPLFSAEGIECEIHAVEQENDRNIDNEAWRSLRVRKETANPNHPFSRFSTGNRETLQQIDRTSIIKWHNNHYSADRAFLVVYSPLPLEELKKLTETCFGKMPKRKTCPFRSVEPMTSALQRENLITVEPLDPSTRSLKVSWELSQDYASHLLDHNAHHLTTFLLNSCHPGSLLEHLKEAGWVESLDARCTSHSDNSAFFWVEFNLTPTGLEAFETVIKTLYHYLRFIQNQSIPSFLFDEIQTITQLEYVYQQRVDPFDYAESYASVLTRLDLDRFPDQLILFKPFDPAEMETLFSELTLDRACFMLIASEEVTHLPNDQKEKWFGVEYGLHSIDQEKLAEWAITDADISFALPNPSPFIPDNLSLLPSEPVDSQTPPKPVCIADSDGGKAYFWRDDCYYVPKIHFHFRLCSPLFDGSAKNTVLKDLFIRALGKKILPLLYQAERGGLSASVGSNDLFDVTLTLSGYSDKALEFLDTLLTALVSVELTPESFHHQCALLENLYSQSSYGDQDSPVDQSLNIAQETLNLYPPYLKKKQALENLTFADFIRFKKNFFKSIYLEAMFAGNLTEDDALLAWKKIEQIFHANPYLQEDHYNNKLLLLSQTDTPYKIHHKTEATGDAALLILQGAPFSFSNAAANMILSHALHQSFYDTLRTEKKMAYALGMSDDYQDGHYLNYFWIQSTSYQSHELLCQIDSFIDDFLARFEEVLPKERLEAIRSSFIDALKKPPETLAEMTSLLTTLAFDREGDFMRLVKIIDAAENLSYHDFKQYAMTYFSRENKNRLAITIDGKPPHNTFYTLTTPYDLRKLILPIYDLPWEGCK